MHCANLDALVKDMKSVHLSTPPATTIPAARESIVEDEAQPDEDTEILRMVLDIGIVVLEGRLPHRKMKRGYIEGPHCVLQPPRTQVHRCDYTNYVCERAEKYRRLMEAIWDENKTICIELRICADCSCGEEQVWKNSISKHDYVLEQWIFEITNFRNNEDGIGIMNGYGLLQAIRSQIHFSQLSAWWSSNQAQLPKNITYHVIPLTQVDLNCCTIQHTFPVLAFSSTYLQVKVRSQPRSEALPKIHCPVHCTQNDVVDDRMKIYCDRKGKHHCQAVEDFDENENESFCDGFVGPEAIDGVIDGGGGATPRIVRTMKYCCSTSKDAPKRNQPQNNECAVGDKRFSTFQKNPKDFASRYFGHSTATPKRSTAFRHSSSFLVDGSSSSTSLLDPLECRKAIVDTAGSRDLYRLRKELSPFNATTWNNTSSATEITRTRLPHLRTWLLPPPSRNSSPSSECCADDSTAAFRRPAKHSRTTEDERSEDDVHWQADLNVTRSDIPLAKVVTAFGAGDSCLKTGLHFSGRTSLRKDSNNNNNNNNAKMVEIRGNGGEVTKRNVKSGQVAKSADKLRNAVVRKYFRAKKVAAKPLLPLFGNVIESVLSGRMYFSRVVDDFKIKITSSVPYGGHSSGTELTAAAYYYHFGDVDLPRSYLVKSCIPDREKGIQILSTGQLQVSVFNTENSLIKVFIVPYDLSDMPRCTKTYIRHSNYYAPTDVTKYSIKWLQSLIQFKCVCSKSGRLYLQNEINIIIFQKSDLNTACELQQSTELKHHNVTEVAYK